MVVVGITPGLRAQENDYATKVKSSMQQAATLYPTVTIEGSPLNVAFASEVHRLQNENPAFFTSNSDWPLMLMAKTAAQLGILPAAPTQKVVRKEDLRNAKEHLSRAEDAAGWAVFFPDNPPGRRQRALDNLEAAKENLFRLQQQYDIQQAPVRAARAKAAAEADEAEAREEAREDARKARNRETQAESDAQMAESRARDAEQQVQQLKTERDENRPQW